MAPRKKRCRRILQPPDFAGYNPDKSERLGTEMVLLYEEFEALRLADYENLRHDQAAGLMDVSRPSFARIYEEARRKIACALVEARPIRFEAGCAYFSRKSYKTVNNYQQFK